MRDMPDTSLTPEEWAWCAGLFEGEGCISFTGLNCVRLTVHMCDRDVVERLDALWPSRNGVRQWRSRCGNHSASYRWEVGERHRAEGFLVGVMPWLGKRRHAKAVAGLARLKHNLGQGGALNARARQHR